MRVCVRLSIIITDKNLATHVLALRHLQFAFRSHLAQPKQMSKKTQTRNEIGKFSHSDHSFVQPDTASTLRSRCAALVNFRPHRLGIFMQTLFYVVNIIVNSYA